MSIAAARVWGKGTGGVAPGGIGPWIQLSACCVRVERTRMRARCAFFLASSAALRSRCSLLTRQMSSRLSTTGTPGCACVQEGLPFCISHAALETSADQVHCGKRQKGRSPRPHLWIVLNSDTEVSLTDHASLTPECQTEGLSCIAGEDNATQPLQACDKATTCILCVGVCFQNLRRWPSPNTQCVLGAPSYTSALESHRRSHPSPSPPSRRPR